jgi:hypothetical protein
MDRIESAVAQQCGNGRKIHRFDQAASSVMPEPMRVNMRDIGATTEHSQQVSNAAICVRPALATENGPFSDRQPNCSERLTYGCVQRNDASLVALASLDEGFSKARLQHQVRPPQVDQFVDAQARVQQRSDHGIRHGSSPLDFAAEPLTLNRTEAPWRQRLIGDGLEFGRGARLDQAGILSQP